MGARGAGPCNPKARPIAGRAKQREMAGPKEWPPNAPCQRTGHVICHDWRGGWRRWMRAGMRKESARERNKRLAVCGPTCLTTKKKSLHVPRPVHAISPRAAHSPGTKTFKIKETLTPGIEPGLLTESPHRGMGRDTQGGAGGTKRKPGHKGSEPVLRLCHSSNPRPLCASCLTSMVAHIAGRRLNHSAKSALAGGQSSGAGMEDSSDSPARESWPHQQILARLIF